LGYVDRASQFRRQVPDDGFKYILGPGAVADYRDLDGCDADVEEVVLAIGGQSLELMSKAIL
jgi:hypothetical protein